MADKVSIWRFDSVTLNVIVFSCVKVVFKTDRQTDRQTSNFSGTLLLSSELRQSNLPNVAFDDGN